MQDFVVKVGESFGMSHRGFLIGADLKILSIHGTCRKIGSRVVIWASLGGVDVHPILLADGPQSNRIALTAWATTDL